MDEQQRHIMEDLSGLLKGEVRCDPLTVSMYSTDASLYQVAPLGVVYPRDGEDVVTVARYSAETQIPLIPRGAGTGLAGGAVGSGLIVDFSRYMHRIEEIGSETVRIQPGIVHERLNRTLRETGRYFPPDPSNTNVTTIGGMLGVDAAGSHSVRVGSMRDHVRSIEMVLVGGHPIEFGNESLAEVLSTQPPQVSGVPLLHEEVGRIFSASRRNGIPSDEDAQPHSPSADFQIKRTIISKLAKLLADAEPLIRAKQPALVRNCCGYYLRGVLRDGSLHVPRMLVGSEGTLGLFTSATLHTAPLPAHRGVVLILFGQLQSAIRTVQAISQQQPSACDLLDRRLLSLAREEDERFAELISPAAEAALLVEQTGLSDHEVRDRIRAVIQAVHTVNLRAVVAREAYSFDDVEFLWSLPEKVVPLLARLKGHTRPLPFVEDVAVPPERLHEFLVRAQKIFQKHQVTASLYAHAAAGQLHLRPFLPIPGFRDGTRIEAIARDIYQAVFALGGTISGEHGDGLSRTAFIRSQYGPLYRVFQQIKDVFDPHNLMNPGKIVNDDPHVTLRHIRPPVSPPPQLVDLQLQWTPDEMTQAAVRCNSCGHCRTQESLLRMCPFFRIDRVEHASPRSKANVIRNLAAGELDPREFSSAGMKRLADLCFNCKQCELECPSNVNIPHMMIEAKAAYVAAEGLHRADWILSRAHSFGALGSTASLAANWMIASPAARWFLEKLFGIARQRKLPQFARRSFLRSAGRELRKPPKNGRGVVYFVSEYANYYDPELARAFVAVLKHNGVGVSVPPGQTTSGMAMVSAGDLDAAREVAEKNVRELAEAAREGIPIVCTEPSAALCLQQEYPMLIDHPDVELVASRVIDAGAYLEQLHQAGKLNTDFGPLDLKAGHHTPCHLHALGNGSAFPRLLSLIPQFKVHRIDLGCSGMAGAFGLTEQNFRTSIRIGWGLISRMRAGDLDIGTTECSSCKFQMEQGTTRPTVHPVKLLALSYGLMPEIREKLNPSTRKLVVS